MEKQSLWGGWVEKVTVQQQNPSFNDINNKKFRKQSYQGRHTKSLQIPRVSEHI